HQEKKGYQESKPLVRSAPENEEADATPDRDDERVEERKQSGIATHREAEGRELLEPLCRQRPCDVTGHKINTCPLDLRIVHREAGNEESQARNDEHQPRGTDHNEPAAR